jgi:hypothetical protein
LTGPIADGALSEALLLNFTRNRIGRFLAGFGLIANDNYSQLLTGLGLLAGAEGLEQRKKRTHNGGEKGLGSPALVSRVWCV